MAKPGLATREDGQVSKRCDRDSLDQYARFADALIEAASKEEVARCARLLAHCLARYKAAYGDLPEVESLLLRGMEARAPANASALADGLKNLVSTLASVARSPEERPAA